ncbi:Cytochrome P450 [Vigna unguiculata]|uniref:Cytochrome P450 n=1 Tax=Vigna unguiculata TaxID=3917 RepID=A0A4D6N2P4_VIGUN|nr:Cytochrome P450 [Vigna unguiculata]QCE06345.1 Cytochrome P450 [Vigna unguiculata]
MEFEILVWLLLLFATPLWFLATILFKSKPPPSPPSSNPAAATAAIPKVYPIIGSVPSIIANKHRRIHWMSDILHASPSSTFVLHRGFGSRHVFTANPTVVHHILKTNFPLYQKGPTYKSALNDFLGQGIFNTDGAEWKLQRQISSHEFSTHSLRKFIETVVDVELSDGLLPLLNDASQNKTIIPDFQNILQRFTLDNICKISFGFDPECLLRETPFTTALTDAQIICSKRLHAAFPLIWKIKKVLNLGSEKRLKEAVPEVKDLARRIMREKKKELGEKETLDSVDLLSRFLSSGHSDEDFVIDIIISFIIAGRDTTSLVLTWFFWLLSKHPHVEEKVLKEVTQKDTVYTHACEEMKDMVYTHAALCETMRLYPPVPMNSKEAMRDDVLPNGSLVKKGWRVTYHIYAMGRSEKIWGSNWAEFRPERWLTWEEVEGRWRFEAVDAFTYPVFQAGPRVCLGKEMAFLQMKRMVAGILRRFKVISEVAEPKYDGYFTSFMVGGFPVRIQNRN